MRRQQAEDWPALQKLCVTITPQRVRQAEGGIAPTAGWDKQCKRYVMPAEGREGGSGCFPDRLCRGSGLHWLRVLVHPESRHHAREGLVQWGLAVLAGHPAETVYCSVRQYKRVECARPCGLRALEAETTRALMAKQTVRFDQAIGRGIRGDPQEYGGSSAPNLPHQR